jgi:hypothetical protein
LNGRKHLNPETYLKFDQKNYYQLCLISAAPNGLRYLRVGGRGFCLGGGKIRSEENA